MRTSPRCRREVPALPATTHRDRQCARTETHVERSRKADRATRGEASGSAAASRCARAHRARIGCPGRPVPVEGDRPPRGPTGASTPSRAGHPRRTGPFPRGTAPAERACMLVRVRCATVLGIQAIPVDVEVEVAPGMPHYHLVGLAERAVQEAKVRVAAAIRNLGIAMPSKRVVVNLAPGDLRKEGTGFDLAIGMALVAAIEAVPAQALAGRARGRRAVALGRGEAGAGRPPDRHRGEARRRAEPRGPGGERARGVGGGGARRPRRRATSGRSWPGRAARRGSRRRSGRPALLRPGARRSTSRTWPARTGRSARWRWPPRAATTSSCSVRPAAARPCWRGGSPASCRRSRSTRRSRRRWSTASPGSRETAGLLTERPFRAPHHYGLRRRPRRRHEPFRGRARSRWRTAASSSSTSCRSSGATSSSALRQPLEDGEVVDRAGGADASPIPARRRCWSRR